MQCQCNTQGFLSKLKKAPSQAKINVTSKSPVGDISVVTLIRTDTTLDHSQKAEKVCQHHPQRVPRRFFNECAGPFAWSNTKLRATMHVVHRATIMHVMRKGCSLFCACIVQVLARAPRNGRHCFGAPKHEDSLAFCHPLTLLPVSCTQHMCI